MLILADSNPSLKIAGSFFESMEKLQVLDLTCLSFTSLPSTIELLENLNSLNLDFCNLEDVTVLGKLKALQFLSFHGSKIVRLPKEIGELTELKFLDLTRCIRLKVIEPGLLGSLVNLEELFMEDSFDQWEAEDRAPRSNASLVELKSMKKLNTMTISIPCSTNLSIDLPFGELKKYIIQIGDVWHWSSEFKESNTLKLKLDSSNLLLKEWVQKCLQGMQDLHLDGLQDGDDSIHNLCVKGFQGLKHLYVQNSPSFHYVFHSKEYVQCITFTRLESLFLKNLNNLKKICHGCLALESFSKLKIVKVDSCGKIKHLFPLSMKRIISQLEDIEINRCHLMQQVVVDVEADEDGDEIYDDTKVESCNLRRLTLQNLPKMTSFYKTMDNSVDFFDKQQVLFPSLEELKLSSMCQLKRIWHNPLHEQSFCKLASLTVELCENLSYVFPSNSMDRLPTLSKIEVVGCPSLEALFEPVTLSSEKRQKPLKLSALKKLKLLNLPRLTDILKSDCEVTLTFPSLMEVNVRRCHSLSYLFSSTTAKTLHELVVLDVSCCNNLQGIIMMEEGKGKTTETFEFRHLTKLKLGDLASLICFSLEDCAGDGLYPLFDEKIAFPKLEELHIKGVQQEELWNNKILVESFYYLKVLKVKQCFKLVNVIPSFMSERPLRYMESLKVEGCPHLRNLFTMSMAKSLGQLRYLGLNGCGEMEYIVTKEEEKPEEATEKIVIPQLVTLYLHSMPKLKSFCQGKHILKWPSLKEFAIEDCKAVKVILGDVSCRKLEGCNPTHQPLFLIEKVGFPCMESMKISHMNSMEKIWLDDLSTNAFSKLKTLIVTYCEKLSSIFSYDTILTSFRNLEKLTMTNCDSVEVIYHVQEFNFSEAHPTINFQLRELVLTQLPKMKHLWSGFPRGALTFGHLRCLKVVKSQSLKSLFPVSMAKSMSQLEELEVQDCGVEEIVAEEDEGVGSSTRDLFFPKLTTLRFVDLPKLSSFYRNSHTSTWPLLKDLRVAHCGKMRSFSFACSVQGWQGTTTNENPPGLLSAEKVIPQLEGLTLVREDVGMMQHYIFGNLKGLTLGCYHDENVTFPSDFLLRRFPNLASLWVDCSSFEEIFPEDAFGHGGVNPHGGLIDMKRSLKELGHLKHLVLVNLCNLRRVWKDGSLMVEILKQIEYLWVWQCPSLSIVFPSPTSFRSLTELEVKDCSGLVHMGTCSAVTSLVHLTRLILRYCGAMEGVITNNGNGAEEISFTKLQLLRLDGLPSLESFSPTNCSFMFPSLVHIFVKQCPKMNIFCKGALRTPKLDKVLLSDEDDEGHWEGDLNTTIRTLSTCDDPHRI